MYYQCLSVFFFFKWGSFSFRLDGSSVIIKEETVILILGTELSHILKFHFSKAWHLESFLFFGVVKGRFSFTFWKSPSLFNHTCQPWSKDDLVT